jgi:glycosyltransferase involved in cell wall biosynthesis
VVGCAPRDAWLAFDWLPVREFTRRIRINWKAPATGIIIGLDGPVEGGVHLIPKYYTSPPAQRRFFAPYFAHPEFYKRKIYLKVLSMRAEERDVKVFFAGTQSLGAYSDNFNFNILNRYVILDHVLEQFRPHIVNDVDRVSQDNILFILNSDTRDVLSVHQLSIEEYMAVMSRSQFFLCPPGYLMPHSHNLIEAMSVGAIPITNYASCMHPPLTPGENCLAFSTLQELEPLIRRVLQMQPVDISRMREAVLEYYDKYLDPKNFANQFLETAHQISEIIVNDESGR